VAILLKMRPGFTIREADAYYKMWCFAPSYRDKMRDALRTAGLPAAGLISKARHRRGSHCSARDRRRKPERCG
jgi:hypothetical protein